MNADHSTTGADPATKRESVERIHCNKCGSETRHEVLVERWQPGSEVVGDGMSIDWLTTWTVLECCGCESVSLRRKFWFSEWDYGPERVEEVEYFPPRVSRRKPAWLDSMSGPIEELLDEMYVALHADSRRLALMGARTVVDMCMVGKVGDVGGFEQKLKALEKGGYLSSRDRKTLEAALDAAHAAAHRGHVPDSDHLNHVIDIVENLLQGDRLAGLAPSIRGATPARTRKGHTPDDDDRVSGSRGRQT